LDTRKTLKMLCLRVFDPPKLAPYPMTEIPSITR
jgi:hypothetical protein